MLYPMYVYRQTTVQGLRGGGGGGVEEITIHWVCSVSSGLSKQFIAHAHCSLPIEGRKQDI